MAVLASPGKAPDAKSVLAAPHPLVLEEVAYPSDTEVLARAELTRARRNSSLFSCRTWEDPSRLWVPEGGRLAARGLGSANGRSIGARSS